jgi:hypothetical protein
MVPTPAIQGVILKKTFIALSFYSTFAIMPQQTTNSVTIYLILPPQYTRPFSAIQIGGNKNYISNFLKLSSSVWVYSASSLTHMKNF